jgi:hypothetical protein
MATRKQFSTQAMKGKDAQFGAVQFSDGRFLLGNPVLAIDTNFDVQTTAAVDFIVGGQLFTLATGADFDTGTAKTIAIDQWAAALLSVDTDGTPYVQWGGDRATEAAAIEALDALTPTGDCVVGYVTVLTDDGEDWVAGTDALQGGTGGQPSDDTNYYAVCGWVK